MGLGHHNVVGSLTLGSSSLVSVVVTDCAREGPVRDQLDMLALKHCGYIQL